MSKVTEPSALSAIHLVESLLRDLADLQQRLPELQRAAFDEGVRLCKLNTVASCDTFYMAEIEFYDHNITAFRDMTFPDLPLPSPEHKR